MSMEPNDPPHVEPIDPPAPVPCMKCWGAGCRYCDFTGKVAHSQAVLDALDAAMFAFGGPGDEPPATVQLQQGNHCKLCDAPFVNINGRSSTTCDCARKRPVELAAAQKKWDESRPQLTPPTPAPAQPDARHLAAEKIEAEMARVLASQSQEDTERPVRDVVFEVLAEFFPSPPPPSDLHGMDILEELKRVRDGDFGPIDLAAMAKLNEICMYFGDLKRELEKRGQKMPTPPTLPPPSNPRWRELSPIEEELLVMSHNEVNDFFQYKFDDSVPLLSRAENIRLSLCRTMSAFMPDTKTPLSHKERWAAVLAGTIIDQLLDALAAAEQERDKWKELADDVVGDAKMLYNSADMANEGETTGGAALRLLREANEALSFKLAAAEAKAERMAKVKQVLEWHEDDGPVVWWKFPVREPAWIGTPLDEDWPGYHTHWTPHPVTPAPTAPTPAGTPGAP